MTDRRRATTETSPLPPRSKSNHALPLYYQVGHLIRHRIATGEYARASQIPSEHELRQEMGVSRVTVREALRELVDDGMLVKIQGKGTFVASEPPTGLPPIKFTGLIEELYDRVLQLEVRHVESAKVPLTDELRALLSVGPKEREAVVFRRTRFVNGEPFSYTVNHLPASIGSRVKADDLYKVPLMKILDDLHIPIVRAHETVEAAPADPYIAERLGIPVLYPVMHIKRIMYTDHDRPFELVETWYRADKYQYSVELLRVKRNGAWTWSHQGVDTNRDSTMAKPSSTPAASSSRKASSKRR